MLPPLMFGIREFTMKLTIQAGVDSLIIIPLQTVETGHSGTGLPIRVITSLFCVHDSSPPACWEVPSETARLPMHCSRISCA